MKRFMLLLAVVLPFALSAVVSLHVDIPAWHQSRTGSDALLPLLMQPGNPAVPVYNVPVLLPMGERLEGVQVELNYGSPARNNVSLDFVRAPQTISNIQPSTTVKNPQVWQRNAPYPQTDFTYSLPQMMKGYSIVYIRVHAWKYNPVQKTLSSATSADITLSTVHDEALQQEENAMLLTNESTQSTLRSMVINPERMASYSKQAVTPQIRTINLTTPHKLIIVTSQSRIPWFTDYVAWKESKGISTGIYAIEDVCTQYPGADNPTKLRNFITAAYTAWTTTATPLEYVILGGDDEIIPIRGVYGHVGETVDNWMPCDLYYGCLNGTWNANNNNLWGEYPADNPDLLPEVSVGRFPAETQTEFEHIFAKSMYYVDNNTYSNNMVGLYGENLNWNPVTWGGDYKDDVALHIPDTYHFNRYYEEDGTYSAQAVWNSINQGVGILNHMGHANETFLMGQGNNTIESLTNTEYGMLYSQGCYPAAFDQRTSGDGESIGEHLLTANGGLYAFIGNTRYGWYMPGSIDGPSEYFDRQFFSGMFEHNHPQIGKAMEYSLAQNLAAAQTDEVMLWCYYETILFGDPSISVKLPNPDLPNIHLTSYRFDDVEGDGDGNLNPGELIRLYFRVQALPGWHDANWVWVNTEGLPEGVSAIICHQTIPYLAAGAYTDSTLYITFQLPQDMAFGHYTFNMHIRATDPVTGANLVDKRYPASFDVTLMDSHFPVEFNWAGKSAAVVADHNLDGNKSILYVDVTGDGHFINSDGVVSDTFNREATENINRSFAMAPFTIANTPMNAYGFASRNGHMYAMAHKDDNTTTFIDYDTQSLLLYTPIFADLNGDGSSELIACSQNHKLYAVNQNNQLLPGFPVELTGAFNTEFAVADIDNDGSMEIIAGTADGNLWVINADGSTQTGFPVMLNGGINGAPLVTETNLIAVGTHNTLYLVNASGQIVVTTPIAGDMAAGAICADINFSGSTEIVFVTTSGKLYVVSQDGTILSGFPVDYDVYVTCPPLVADVDGDNHYEIIVQTYMNCIYIANHDGSRVPGFPFVTSYNGSTPATLTDVDGDGNYDLVCGYSNGVIVIKLRHAMGNLDAWTTYRGSLSRQGSYAATGYVPTTDPVALPTSVVLYGNYPNPFNPTTTLRFDLPKAEKATTLIIYNSKGQVVRSLLSSSLKAGHHSVVWNGRDDHDRPVGSGVYFYRLCTEKGSFTRKMILLK